MESALKARSQEHLTRRFLAKAYRIHTNVGLARSAGATAYQVTLSGLKGVVERATTFQLGIFDCDRKRFVGAKERIEGATLIDAAGGRGISSAVEYVFLNPLGRTKLVLEALEWNDKASQEDSGSAEEAERVFAWATVDIGANAEPTNVDFFKGGSHFLLLDPIHWPAEGFSLCGSVTIRAHPRSIDFQNALLRLLPVACFAPTSFLESQAASSAQKSFRVGLSNLRFTLAPGTNAVDAFPAHSVWTAIPFIHNGFQQLSRLEDSPEIALSISTTGDFLSATTPLEFKNVPVHTSTALVVAIRSKLRGETVFRTRGFAVVPLVLGGVNNLRDCDVTILNAPALRGPFSGPDHRTLAMEPRFPLANLGLRLSLDVAFNDTPNPAPTIREIVGANGQRVPVTSNMTNEDIKRIASGVDLKRVSSPVVIPQSSSPGSKPSESMESRPTTTGSTASIPSPSQPTSVAVSRSMPVPQGLPPGTIITSSVDEGKILELHQMLCTIAEELRNVKTMVEAEREERKQDAAAAGGAGGRRSPQRRPETGTRPQPDAGIPYSGPVELVDLDLRRVSITGATRAKLLEKTVPLFHPVTKSVLSGSGLASSILPLSQIGLRLDGVTLPIMSQNNAAEAGLPTCLVATVQGGVSGVRHSGALDLHEVAKDLAVGRTFHLLGPKPLDSTVWVDDVPPAMTAEKESLWKQLRASGSLLVHLYDGISSFYYASFTIPLNRFHRPPTNSHTIQSIDAALFYDATLGMLQPDPNLCPLMTGCGQVHISLVSVGHSRKGAFEGSTLNDPSIEPINSASSGTTDVAKLANITNMQQGGNGGKDIVPRSTSIAAMGVKSGPTVIVVPKLDIADLGLASASASPPSASKEELTRYAKTEFGTTEVGSAKMLGTTTMAMHIQRATYVKKMLEKVELNGGKMPPGGKQPTPSHMAIDAAEMELKFSYVEKKKDEIRSQRIAEHLKRMITTEVKACVAHGRPELLSIPFKNPYPHSSTFHLELPEDSVRFLSLPASQGKTITLGPKEVVTIKLLARYDGVKLPPAADASDSSFLPSGIAKASCVIYTERTEKARVIEVMLECVAAVANRRVEIYGPPGFEQRKGFYSRAFTPLSLENDLLSASRNDNPTGIETIETLSAKIGRLCRFPVVSDPSVVADTDACIDPITQEKVSAWETVTLTAICPQRGEQSKRVLVFLYADPECETLAETWEVIISSSVTLETEPVRFGQTSQVNVPVRCDDCFSSASNVAVAKVVGSTTAAEPSFITLKVRPRSQGLQSVLLHARIGSVTERYIVRIPISLPTPTYVANIAVSNAELGVPIFRRLTFVNQGLEQAGYKVTYNYHQYVRITPQVFALGPQGTQQLAIQIEGLHPGERGSVVRYPIWVFVNTSNTDQTIDSYLLDVQVGGGPVMISR